MNEQDLITPASLCREIAETLALPAGQVRTHWQQETVQPGTRVAADARQFGVTPHVYDEAMERLYREGQGFVFETLCYWVRAERQAWSRRALQRLAQHAQRRGCAPGQLRVLMLGDGSGSDTLLLACHGYRPTYVDVPGSVTAHFAASRFARHGVEVRREHDLRALPSGGFDVVWSFDVLEHLPDLPAAVRAIGNWVGDHGLALITDACLQVRPDLPTHLSINQPLAPEIPRLFRDAGLELAWYAPQTDFCPCEYRRANDLSVAERIVGRWRAWRLRRKRLQRLRRRQP